MGAKKPFVRGVGETKDFVFVGAWGESCINPLFYLFVYCYFFYNIKKIVPALSSFLRTE